MLDDKKIKEIRRNVERFMKDETILKTKDNGFVDFFLNNSKDSLDSAKLLFELSIKDVGHYS